MRSPTAADIAARIDGVSADFAGLSADAEEKLSSEQIEWADIIFVMERRQRKRLTDLLGNLLHTKKIRVLNIPDKYSYMDKELVQLLEPKIRAALDL